MKIRYFLIIFILIQLFSCQEEFFIDSDKYEEFLVVDGFITNNPGPYKITLSKSSKTDAPQTIPYTGCIVQIIDDIGNTEILSEESPGIYSTVSPGFRGIVGNSYKLSVITNEDKCYETDYQEIKDIIEIDTVYHEQTTFRDSQFPYGLPGLRFYVDTKESIVNENYFLWTMNETYEYDIDHRLAYVEDRFGDYIYSNPRYDTLVTCWASNIVKDIYVGKTENLSAPHILRQPINFVGTNSKRLTKKYSLLVNQYVISQSAYNYWYNIQQMIAKEDFFTSRQPFNVKGNLVNCNNENEIVLGYFSVASISQKRIFADKLFVPFYYSKCLVITDRVAISDWKRNHSSPYYWVQAEDGTNGITYKQCIDCRNEGGQLQKPEFWID
jgi:hypothetical protein